MTPPPARESLLEQVRSACAAVAAAAELVHVDEAKLDGYAGSLLDAAGPTGPTGPTPAGADPWAIAGDVDGDVEHTVALVLALDAINFGSGYHPLVHKRAGCSGATTMATALREAAAREPITVAFLEGLTAADAHELFGQPDDGGPLAELMARFASALNDLGGLVAGVYDHSFVRLADAGAADALVERLTALTFFDDVARHHELVVPLHKRAQLAAADLDRAFPRGFDGTAPLFDDLDRLTAFADNLVPHVLRVDGVLRYDADLAATIDAGELLAPGSIGEVEIRAVGVHAVELLRAALAARGVDVRSSQLDQVLWSRGGGARYKAVPRHRTRSTAY